MFGRLSVKQQGRGTICEHAACRVAACSKTPLRAAFTYVCRDNGVEPGAHVVNRLIVPARAEELKFFGIPQGSLLLYIQRIRTADEQPIFEENIFLPYDGYERLLTDDLENASIFDKIAEVGGSRPERTPTRTVEAVRATSEQASRLSIAQGDPLLFLNVCFNDRNDQPVCIGRQYYVGSRYRFEL